MTIPYLGATGIRAARPLHRAWVGFGLPCLLVAVLSGPVPLSAQTLYAIEFDGDPTILAEINPLTGADISTLSSSLVGGRGMATDPTTGTMYVSRAYKGSFDLVTIDPSDGSTSTIGTYSGAGGTMPSVRDLTFDNTGQMWGVTGMNGDLAQSVLPIDKSDASVGSVLATISGSSQMTIAYRPADGLLYVYSFGVATATDGPASYQFETIDPSDGTTTPIGLSGSSPGSNVLAMTFDPPNNLFRFFDQSGNYWTLSPGGVQTDTGNDNATQYMGLAFDQTTTIPVELMGFAIE
ncbi:MAG: hypothetical protein AAF657_24115 [Acidobacteriota bacterium]